MSVFLVVLLLVAGLARAVHDALAHSPACLARWGAFWDARDSWRLKYKNGEPALGARFPGSTTVFVALTDAWHASNAVAWGCVDTAFLLAAWPAYRWWAVAAVVVRRAVFEPVYRQLRKGAMRAKHRARPGCLRGGQ